MYKIMDYERRLLELENMIEDLRINFIDEYLEGAKAMNIEDIENLSIQDKLGIYSCLETRAKIKRGK